MLRPKAPPLTWLRPLLAVVAFFILAGLAEADRRYPYTFTDASGREITIEKPLTRIVSLNRQTSESIVALSCGDRILATGDATVRNNPYLGLEHRPQMGHTESLNIEAIIALNPEAVLTYSARSPNIEVKLEGAGIKVIRLDNHKPGTVDQELLILGRLLDQEKEAQELLNWKQNLRRLAAEQEAKIPEDQRKTVAALLLGALNAGGAFRLYPVLDDSGKASWGEGYVAILAGGLDAFPTVTRPVEARTTTIHINDEYMLKQNPQAITFHGSIFGGYDGPDARAIQDIFDHVKKISSINLTEAGENGRFYFFHTDLTGGNKREIGVLQLMKYLYPEVMVDIAPENLLRQYFDNWMPRPFQGTWFYADGDL